MLLIICIWGFSAVQAWKKANSTDNGLYIKLSDVTDGDSENKQAQKKILNKVAHDELQRNQFSHTCLKKTTLWWLQFQRVTTLPPGGAVVYGGASQHEVLLKSSSASLSRFQDLMRTVFNWTNLMKRLAHANTSNYIHFEKLKLSEVSRQRGDQLWIECASQQRAPSFFGNLAVSEGEKSRDNKEGNATNGLSLLL